MALTIAYCTARIEPNIEWFFESLAKQLNDERINIMVVDHWLTERGQYKLNGHGALGSNVLLSHVAPKPNVWQGQFRLTKEDWFAASSVRNTALCLCKTTHLAYCDDLSVLQPGWLDAVKEAVAGNYIGCGAYRKVRNLKVENGIAVSYEETESGRDDRLHRVSDDVSPCTGSWLFGCSLVAPVEDLLQVGGWPEYCDGLGSEDYCMGWALSNAGKHLRYDRRMMTLESEELHHVEPAMKRTDKGVSPNDKSHRALEMAKHSTFFPNYFPTGGIRAVRDSVLAGNPFPVIQEPRHDWFDGQAIEEM